MSTTIADIGLSVFKRITNFWLAGKSDSLIDYTRVARVEPIVLIDTDVLFHEALPVVQQSVLSIFAGYYMQAVALSNQIGRIDVAKQLDKLNPNRSPIDAIYNRQGDIENFIGSVSLLSLESYEHRLPMFAGGHLAVNPTPGRFSNKVALEAAAKDEKVKTEFSLGRDLQAELEEVSNLSIGKQFTVTISDGAHTGDIPIAIRLLANSIPTRSVVHILSGETEDTSVKERYHAWKSGRIEFIKDLVLCQDLIDAHKKNLLANQDEVYSSVLKRNRGNQLAAIISENPSVATASNILIMSNTTAEQIESNINGKLSNFKTRQKLFDKSYLMIIVVINKEWDIVTFYHRGIDSKTELNVRDLKTSNRGSGPDVSDILKAYQIGNAPSL